MTWRPDYITLADLKNYFRIPASDTQDDVELSLWITSASRAVDKRCSGVVDRQFGQEAAPVVRTYYGCGYFDADLSLWVLDIDDVQDVTGFLVNGIAYASPAVATLLPANAAADGEPYTQIGFPSAPSGATVLTGRWGWTAFPTQVKSAVRLQCNRWNFRRDAPAGVAGSPDQGSEVRLLARLDPDVATVLDGLARRRKAG